MAETGADEEPSAGGEGGGLPGLSSRQLAGLLRAARAQVSGPGRVIAVCRFSGGALTDFRVEEGPPGGDKAFVRDCQRMQAGYDVGSVVPVVLARTAPAPFAGLALAVLPWADARGEWCTVCGARRGAGAHSCA